MSRRVHPDEADLKIANFHMSDGFQPVDWANLEWPAHYRIDYVRVYQRGDGHMGCDPPERPTKDFIERHKVAYSNPNLTTWDLAGKSSSFIHLMAEGTTETDDAGQTWPKNRLKDGC